MKRFAFAGLLECPSYWTCEKAEAFIRRQMLSTSQEQRRLIVLEAPDDPMSPNQERPGE